ncbi:putative cytochrome P450 [Xylaria sp. CBS 124048]|nr:putative cytochrome P450 [Xylaria sp. CBS 124048]
MDQLPVWQSLCAGVPALVLLFFAIDAAQTKNDVRKQEGFPFFASSWPFTPRFIPNTRFAWDAARLLKEGYNKYKNSPYQLIQTDGNVVVLPHHLLQELACIPASIASPNAGLERDFIGAYTGLHLILHIRLHHAMIQRKLTPRLNVLTPSLEKELASALQEHLPKCEKEWAEFQPYYVFRRVVARLSGHLTFGASFQHKQAWEKLQLTYMENLFITIFVLRMFPTFLRPILSLLLPSYWLCCRSMAAAKKLLRPTVVQLLKENDAGINVSQAGGVDQLNILNWLVDSVKGADRDPDTIMHALVLVGLASVHTVLLRIVSLLYDLVDNPDFLDELRAEVETVTGDSQNESAYDKLEKLDSAMVESQRISPMMMTGLKRIFKESYTFQNGLHIPKGTYVCMPVYTIENDPAITPHPEVFDGLRQYRALRQAREKDPMGAINKFQFSNPTTTSLAFGYGRAACPGRFVATLEIKMMFVKLLTEYDFKFLPGNGRPSNIHLFDFMFAWPWTKMLVKRR